MTLFIGNTGVSSYSVEKAKECRLTIDVNVGVCYAYP